SIFKNRFQMKDQICIIDAACFEEAYETFVSVEKQIASSALFVINKVDLASAKTISTIKDIVKTHNTSPEFYETTYADIPMDRFFIQSQPAFLTVDMEDPVSFEELETAIEKLMENPDTNATPPDRLMSAVYSWKGNDIESFKIIIPQFPKKLIRAKGVLGQGPVTYLFNLVMSRHTVEIYTPVKDCSPLINNVVFIGSPEVIKELEALSLEYPELAQKSVFDPMQAS
ncbi:MAG: hypothetical protein L3J69_01055, partial [Desulfobacula sp.]|nr:hypothetical protein [Desulfobacula sp.]